MEEKIDIKAKTIKVDTGKGNTIKVTMSYGEQSTLEELLIAYLGQEIAGGSAAEYYGAAEPPVRCGESHLSGLTEPLRSL
ncbi:MAG: hypothetical protein ACLSFF_02155 [Roseburia intestinalis]